MKYIVYNYEYCEWEIWYDGRIINVCSTKEEAEELLQQQ